MASYANDNVQLVNEKSDSKCYNRWAKYIAPIVISILSILTITFVILWVKKVNPFSSPTFAVEKGIIGFPITLPDDGKYVQWTFLQLNDVYEMLPMDNQRKGGLARVAYLRKLLLKENEHTFTLLAGDLISPSALSQSIINGTELSGQHMIECFNTLGLDYMTFGNHEFDYSDQTIITQRMDESKFKWISTNVLDINTNKSFHTSIPYTVLVIESVNVLIFGLTIEVDNPYIQIINSTSLIPFVQEFLKSISNVKYNVLVALTHLSVSTDIELLENIPQIDLIIGGHEHANYHLHRGSKYTPIYKADANAFSVYIHRCAYNVNTRRFRIYSTLAFVTPEVPEEENTRQTVNYWYDLALQGFETMGYQINRTVSCLPATVELDGRFSSVRNFATLLSNFTCECMLYATSDNQTIVALFDSGSIRIDDVLREKITEYDVLRVLPYRNYLYSLTVPGQILAQVLDDGMKEKGHGMFLSYCGQIERDAQRKAWLIHGQDISKTGQNYNVATMDYAQSHTKLNESSVTILQLYNITQSKSLINYFPTKYPPC